MSSRKNGALYCGFQQDAAASNAGKQLIWQIPAGKTTKNQRFDSGWSVIRRRLTAGESQAPRWRQILK
ncbi:hypothetical protein A1353_15860 [Methylomonas methanica]|uniref:Uncharacterized protein n=1 Tax=Methylomonas methanica TaxID=421 RepID=A0A177M991_METMH|nr:hypothetical protein A1353_15860 [Methylomonas methanica]